MSGATACWAYAPVPYASYLASNKARLGCWTWENDGPRQFRGHGASTKPFHSGLNANINLLTTRWHENISGVLRPGSINWPHASQRSPHRAVTDPSCDQILFDACDRLLTADGY